MRGRYWGDEEKRKGWDEESELIVVEKVTRRKQRMRSRERYFFEGVLGRGDMSFLLILNKK